MNGTVADTLSSRPTLNVVAQGDIRRMVDLESERQAIGCDTTSCLAEIAGAMGASYVIFGRVGRLDDVLFVQLNLFDSAAGRAVAREEVRAARLSELPDRVRPALARLVAPLTGEVPPPVDEPAPAGVLVSPLFWSGAVVGVVGAAAAAVTGGSAILANEALGNLGASRSDKDLALDAGPWLVGGAVLGTAAAAVGGVLVGAALVME